MRERWKGLLSLLVLLSLLALASFSQLSLLHDQIPESSSGLKETTSFAFSQAWLGIVFSFLYLAVLAWKKPLWIEWFCKQWMMAVERFLAHIKG